MCFIIFQGSSLNRIAIYRTSLEGIRFNSINQSGRSFLEAPFLESEVKEAIWGCEDSKSPRPDGYSFCLIKKCWFFLKEDFVCFFISFYPGSNLSNAVASLFLTLIPRSPNPLGLDDFRPICLFGCMYKALAKFLAGRLKFVLNTLVSLCQSAFVPGRQMLDGLLAANEVVDFLKRRKRVVYFLR